MKVMVVDDTIVFRKIISDTLSEAIEKSVRRMVL